MMLVAAMLIPGGLVLVLAVLATLAFFALAIFSAFGSDEVPWMPLFVPIAFWFGYFVSWAGWMR